MTAAWMPGDTVRVLVDWLEGSAEEEAWLRLIDWEQVKTAVMQLEQSNVRPTVDLVLTGNFAAAALTQGGEWTTVLPDFGNQVVARTGRGAGGNIEILTWAAVFASPKTLEEMALKGLNRLWIMSHESWHVVLFQEGEDYESQLERVSSKNLLMKFTAGVLDEFRVERAVYESGFRPPDDSLGLGEIFRQYRRIVRAPLYLESDSRDARRRARFGQCSMHAHQVARLAARMVVELPHHPFQLQAQQQRRRLGYKEHAGHFWDEFTALMAPVPSARVRVAHDDLDGIVHTVARLIATWFDQVGVPQALYLEELD